ncbi:uncharacterized protein LOC143922798 [Arctopsyche grandis]|uniref:uncharacterized protein LOC143922798 n=1 Tax=Arctopsyche grandis TaxID=121162 RepID=UPI00406D8066
MECRLCLCSAGSFVSIYDDPHPPGLAQSIWTCCQLRVRKGDHLPDMICLSCVNNLKLLDSFRNACFQNDTTSRVKLDKYLKVKPEEVWLDDLIWEDELDADLPSNISHSPDDGETHGRKITSRDNMAAIINTSRHILAEELPFPKALEKMSSTHSEVDHKIDFQDKLFTHKNNLVTQKNSDTRRKLHDCEICSKSFTRKYNVKVAIATLISEKTYSYRQIAKKFHVSPPTVAHIAQLVQSGVSPTATLYDKCGRKRKTTPRTDQKIITIALENRKVPNKGIQAILNQEDIDISTT